MQPPPDQPDPRPHSPTEHELRQEAIAWVARVSDREATAEDRQACRQWQAQSPLHARLFEQFARTWRDPDLVRVAHDVAHDERRTKADIATSPQRGKLRWTLAGVACLVALVSGAWYFDLWLRMQADYQTAVGERKSVRLPDQSVALLNTGTALALSFDGATRRVRLLQGEASFAVRPDPARPFVVDGAETAVRAVGTEFVVRRHPGADRITVIEGVVEVTLRQHVGMSEPVSAGQMTETEEGRLMPARPVDVSTAAAWRQGLLVVDGMPLKQVLDEVQRYYAGTIVVWNPAIGTKRVTGTFRLDEPAKILDHLSKSSLLRTISLTDRFVIVL